MVTGCTTAGPSCRDGGSVRRLLVPDSLNVRSAQDPPVPASWIAETAVRDLTPTDLLTEAFWTDFLSGLVVRGLTGVQLAI